MKMIYQLIHNHFTYIFLHKNKLLIATHSHDFVCCIAVFCCYISLFYYLRRLLAANCYALSDEMIFSSPHHCHCWRMSLNLTDKKGSGFIPTSNTLVSNSLFPCATLDWIWEHSKVYTVRFHSDRKFWVFISCFININGYIFYSSKARQYSEDITVWLSNLISV